VSAGPVPHINLPLATPPCVAGDFDTDDYNELHLVSKAEALFEKQLKSAGLDRAHLFSQLAPLFYDSEAIHTLSTLSIATTN